MKAQMVTVPRQSFYERPRENFEHIVGYLDSREASAMIHSELERELEKRGWELMRILLQEHLDNRLPIKQHELIRNIRSYLLSRQHQPHIPQTVISGGTRYAAA